MLKRPESRRQHLGATTVNSPYFTSAAPAPETVSTMHHQAMPGYGYAQPPSPYYAHDSSGYDDSAVQKFKSSSRSKSSSGRQPGTILFFLIWTVAVAGGTFGIFYYTILPRHIKQVEERLNEELEAEKLYKQRYDDLQQHVRHLEQQRDEEAALAQQFNAELSRERQWALEWKEKAIDDDRKAQSFIERIRESSRQQLLRKYGNGPYHVELEISFRGTQDRSDMGWVTLELAGPDDMPHTVYNFLEQVDRGLYGFGEFAFEFNGRHITMAAPVTDGLWKRFEESGISNLLVQEFSPHFNHDTYTIGLTGRPSGPKWYINMRDNSKVHGQGGYAKDGSADPCFGRITRGTDIIDRIHALTGELNPGDWKKIENPVAIISMKRL